jgi:glutathione S-transferase
LITGAKNGSRSIPESSAIATYLIRTFDTEDKFGLKNGDWVRDEVLTSMVSTNLNRIGGFALMLDFGVFKLGEGPMAASFGGKAMFGALGDMERELKEGPKGGYFNGEHPGRADILAEYQITLIKHRNWADLKADYPLLDAWLERVHARDAFKRSLQKGNGYDLTIFPKVPGRL